MCTLLLPSTYDVQRTPVHHYLAPAAYVVTSDTFSGETHGTAIPLDRGW